MLNISTRAILNPCSSPSLWHALLYFLISSKLLCLFRILIRIDLTVLGCITWSGNSVRDLGVSVYLDTVHSNIYENAKTSFSSKIFCKIETVAFSFVFDKYCPIMD